MNGARIVQAFVVIFAASFSSAALCAPYQESTDLRENKVLFFDVLDLAARVDEPKLSRNSAGYVLNCAITNRSNEQLLGLRLIMMVVEPSGRVRLRVAWTEASELEAYSIKTFEFHPPIKEGLRNADQLFVSVDEVIGRETIWRVMDADKALRAYARGQHDVVPVVRTVANKFDPRTKAIIY